MDKRRPGLHKEISTIFDGVPIPKGKGAQQPPDAPKPAFPNYDQPKQPAATPPAVTPPTHSEPAKAKPAYAPPKAQTPTQNTPPQPAKPAKPQKIAPEPPKAKPAKENKFRAGLKPVGQSPVQKVLEKIKEKLLTPKPGVSSSKQITTVVSIPILFIVLVFMVGKNFIKPSTSKANLKGDSNKNAAAGHGKKIQWEIPAPYPATLRDPMQFGPATNKAKQVSGLVVKGIVYSEDNPCAVIGSRILHIGDEVMGATIVNINKNSVEFESDGKRWTQQIHR